MGIPSCVLISITHLAVKMHSSFVKQERSTEYYGTQALCGVLYLFKVIVHFYSDVHAPSLRRGTLEEV